MQASNILIDRHVTARLADFGTSKVATAEELRKQSANIQGTAVRRDMMGWDGMGWDGIGYSMHDLVREKELVPIARHQVCQSIPPAFRAQRCWEMGWAGGNAT